VIVPDYSEEKSDKPGYAGKGKEKKTRDEGSR